MRFDETYSGISASLEEAAGREDVLRRTVKLLSENFAHYSWTGFYMADNGDLAVGPYVGKPTPHTRIKLGEGICGAAATSKKTIIVDDVNADPRFLACSLDTKSEIVVPLMDGDICIGEIDIDSDSLAAFTQEDAAFLEKVARLVVTHLRRFPSEN